MGQACCWLATEWKPARSTGMDNGHEDDVLSLLNYISSSHWSLLDKVDGLWLCGPFILDS